VNPHLEAFLDILKLSPGFNFINILHASFSYKSKFLCKCCSAYRNFFKCCFSLLRRVAKRKKGKKDQILKFPYHIGKIFFLVDKSKTYKTIAVYIDNYKYITKIMTIQANIKLKAELALFVIVLS